MVDSLIETSENAKNTLQPGTPEAERLIDGWWKRFGKVNTELNMFDTDDRNPSEALEVIPAELEEYYDGMFRRHLAEVQDLMTNNGISFNQKSTFAEQEAMARTVIEINGYTDQLTGLKNRKWLEEALETKTKEELSTLTVIFGYFLQMLISSRI